MDPHSGRVLAISGGFSFETSQFDRATQAKRQQPERLGEPECLGQSRLLRGRLLRAQLGRRRRRRCGGRRGDGNGYQRRRRFLCLGSVWEVLQKPLRLMVMVCG
jgi:hypothetical protein